MFSEFGPVHEAAYGTALQTRATAPRIAVLGAGHVGPILARAAAAVGYTVRISSSSDPDGIALITQVLAPGAEPMWAAEAIEASDVIVLAVPVSKFQTIDPALVAGKVVIDPMNYWPPVDGRQPIFEHAGVSSSEIVARRFPNSSIVKTFNHLGYHQIDAERRPAGSPERRALGVAGDDESAVRLVGGIVERIGFDVVKLLNLAAGRVLEPGGPVFGVPLSRPEFDRALRDHSPALDLRPVLAGIQEDGRR